MAVFSRASRTAVGTAAVRATWRPCAAAEARRPAVAETRLGGGQADRLEPHRRSLDLSHAFRSRLFGWGL